jgi:hypothetical protein
MDTVVRWQRLVPAAILLVLCLSLPACRPSKVTPENYDKISTGMTRQEVEALLGPGQKEEGGDGAGVAAQFGVNAGLGEQRGKAPDTYAWESNGKTIKVYFSDGKVTNKQKEGF